ncbi:hypothetical protein D3C86_1071860 [compost metagenome]
MEDLCVRGQRSGQPYITPDNTVCSNDRMPSQYGRIGIDDHIIPDSRVSFLMCEVPAYN